MPKNSNYFILACFVSLFLFSACSDYSKILKSTDNAYKFSEGKRYYQDKKFAKALPLLESVLAAWKGQDKSEEVYYYYCYTEYAMGNLPSASFHFKNFTETFFTSKHLQECAFMHAHSEYDMVQAVELDQSQTFQALQELQLFINMHPDSKYVDSSNGLMDKLRQKLILKDFNQAMLYFNLESYKSAIKAFENLLITYPDIEDISEVNYYIVKSYADLASNSIKDKKMERWLDTEIQCELFLTAFGNKNKFYKKVINIQQTAQKQINILKLN